ncbi:MAG: hypothetical protein A2840_02030 [Candidatus Buchananbacteria bacterium RIFCSPHIGHO2_01_FULL_47_11b]|uniref:Uncharacterized protein n=1 Tax=Candidatus Buchananbacteria bacterium RIFCSPHIGHO2_01_FULL_47_11b TaxID=1797537 RepID=A0A1G1Y7H3_9BACT|nr:MAG: hypothetical protein A2840_02030 [Candidatus Buchananbacteria bacterium RIFCSPHIGHO2_01_FULL_47_11b]
MNACWSTSRIIMLFYGRDFHNNLTIARNKVFLKPIQKSAAQEGAGGMARWSERQPKLLGWLEDSWLSRWLGENSIFVCKEANNV